ncbi:MAG: hypothetical protein JEZ03_15600 [Bacteroidales bacterium]|nr:hypothetical protein [Bacteroidales bacterium]
MKSIKILALTVGLFFFIPNIWAQKDIQDTTITIKYITANYGFHFPGGDLAERFGPASTIGAGFGYKTDANWLWEFNADFLFGNVLREPDFMENLYTSQDHIIDAEGIFSQITPSERGGMFNARVGKIFPVFGPNPNSGIQISVSPGIMYHKIHIEVDNNNAPQLIDDYKKGYDRLTFGYNLEEFIGFIHFDNSNLFNFYGGFEFRQAITKSIRAFDFDKMSSDNKQRIDLMYGIRVGWMIPIFREKRAVEEFIYY